MRVRKEPVVFAAALGLVAWLVLGREAPDGARRGAGHGDAPPLPVLEVPEVARALPAAAQQGASEAAQRREGRLARALFTPPSDTRPLPPLDFQPPPAPSLPVLAPPPLPGPAPHAWGALLRRAQEPEIVAADLFDEALEEELEPEPSEVAPASGKLAPDERAALIEGAKAVYDWIRVGDFHFGSIRNEQRFELAQNQQPILFVEIDPRTGQELYNGQAIAYERERVAEFGFADTVANQLELGRAALGATLSASRYDEALRFADWCLEQRLEAPRALAVAEELYRQAAGIAPDDPAPRIGLARCYEAGFRFEDAFGVYRGLLESGLARDPRVLVPLAQLEARLRLFGRAEARLAEAERYARTAWQVQSAYGALLLERGRSAEALAHLRLANQYEPTGAEARDERVAVRVNLGRALLAEGQVAEGLEAMRKALQADPKSEQARAGELCALLLSGADGARASPGDTPGASGGDAQRGGEVAGFELLLARGLAALSRGEAEACASTLTLAAQADPLRAHLAWRALARLAERAGYPDEALRFADQAVENDPTDAWAWYERGRLLAARDDGEGALESYRHALEIELDLPDVLAAMGRIAWEAGRHADAERYLERALQVEPELAEAHVLRGLNLLESGAVGESAQAFRAALALRPDEPAALGGLAWCAYRQGESEEAVIGLRELDDRRRDQPESDPWRAWAREQIARLVDHLEKVSWSDDFERGELRNNWNVDESAGPTVSLVDGAVRVRGVFRQAGRTRLWQVEPAGDFVALEATLTVEPGCTGRAGVFVSRERSRRNESQVEAEVSLSRHPLEGKPQVRLLGRAGDDAAYADAPGFEWPVGKPVRLRIERVGDAAGAALRISLDGFPVLESASLPTLGRTTSELFVGAFVEGEAGREAALRIDEVEIVFRRR